MTIEDIQALEPYEAHMRNALSDFMHHPGREALRKMDEIYHRTTKQHLVTDASCARCILNTLKRVATLYFATKERGARQPSNNSRKSTKSKKNGA